jgi:hypothetical protein
MGIGLKLCRSIIESHQGRIKVENLYNGQEVTGCVFSFWIPVLPTTQFGVGSAPPSGEPGTSPATQLSPTNTP